MLKNYWNIALRSLLKNKVFSLLNIVGLSVGFAAFFLIMHYVRFERSYEMDHVQSDRIFRVTLDLYNGKEYIITDCETHQLVGPLTKEQMPEVLNFVRFFHYDGLQEIKIGDKVFLEDKMYFADSTVFDIFTLNIVDGKKDALVKPFSAVINQSTARRFFGRTNVVGETFKLENEDYQVTAVISDLSPNTHLKYNILLSHTTIDKHEDYPWYSKQPWAGNNEFTYLLMAPGTDINHFNKKLEAFSISFADKLNDDRYKAEPVRDIHLYSHKSFEPEVNGNSKTVYFLLIIAISILVMAWINYINLSTARSLERAREVGIRKVMGSYRIQLILQFLSESFVVNLTAGLLAIVLFQMALPWLRILTAQPLPCFHNQ
jgi:putative ABC transport system permease protein